jgi:hypothetical protein
MSQKRDMVQTMSLSFSKKERGPRPYLLELCVQRAALVKPTGTGFRSFEKAGDAG